MKTKYYSLKNILKFDAVYNVIFGERSNGKSFAVLEYIIRQFIEHGNQGAIVRRWQDDFTGKRGQTMFDGVVSTGIIEKLTGGEWSGVYYWGSRWFLCRYENDKRITLEKPLAYGFSVTSMEHDKSTSYPNIKTIMFDEFITRSYVPDEFVLFMNLCSTIIRDKTDIKIFMLGNTVNKYCPYFNELGLYKIKEQKIGTIDLYKYGDSRLTVAVEYCENNKTGKPSDFYFAFNNPKLSMITTGAWEMEIYPHLMRKYRPKDILFTYFIQFNGDLLQCEIIADENSTFTYIHRKTTELKNPDIDLIYSPEYSDLPNWKRKITKPASPLEKKITEYFIKDKIFYQDNETGEIIRNYINWCKG